jgi:cytochrome c peroxidase
VGSGIRFAGKQHYICNRIFSARHRRTMSTWSYGEALPAPASFVCASRTGTHSCWTDWRNVEVGETAGVGRRIGGSARWCTWLLLGLSLVAGGAYAQAPSPRPNIDIPADHEPITPIPQTLSVDSRTAKLGAELFHDPRLSGDGSRACSSCHDVTTNGAGASRFDRAPDGSLIPLNTDTVFNAALSFLQNWEGNARSLEDQAAQSLSDPRIMASSLDRALERIADDKVLRVQFELVYGHGPDRENLLDAIATYERSLLTPGSRFDRWLLGDNEALSDEERVGYGLFKSLGCVSCHQGVNVGGNLFERPGIFHRLVHKQATDLRVPSLRNVAVTPPYFHNGSAPTLARAVGRMGYSQLGRTLSKEQIDAIVAFLGSLTGSYQGKPLKAPS